MNFLNNRLNTFLLISPCLMFIGSMILSRQDSHIDSGGQEIINRNDYGYKICEREGYRKLETLDEGKYQIILGVSNEKPHPQGGNFNIWIRLIKTWKLRNIENKAYIYIEIIDSKGAVILKYDDIIFFKELSAMDRGFEYRSGYPDVTSMPRLKEFKYNEKFFLKLKIKLFDKMHEFKTHELSIFKTHLAE